jgi:hypothetical protein
MIKKAVFLAIFLVVLSLGSAFANEIDGLISGSQNLSTTPPEQVYVNPGGLGDALLYGYYNVRNGYETFFGVTNTDTVNGARVRIRFREAATLQLKKQNDCDNGSQEILDFDICLSPRDMWSGVIATDAAGVGTLFGLDTDTYVQVANPTGTWATDNLIFPTAFPNGQEFKFGSGNLGITADQTREGYFEIIGERKLHSPHPTDASYLPCKQQPGQSSGPNCSCGTMLDMDPVHVQTDSISWVDNVLMGQAYIVNTGTTVMFGYVATALADFATPPQGKLDLTPSPLFTANRPNLRDDSESGTIVPVNYALTKSIVYSIMDLDPKIAGKGGLIVTFPTKWATHLDDTATDGTCLKSPSDIFDDTSVLISEYNDQEVSPTVVCAFSPCTTSGNNLPDEVNFVDLDGSGIFTSDGLVSLAVAGNFTNFTLGWISIDLVNNGLSSPPSPSHETFCSTSLCLGRGAAQISHGLPAIGYQVETFGLGKFSSLIPLQYSTETNLD